MIEKDASLSTQGVALHDVLLAKIDRCLEKKNVRLRENLSAWAEVLRAIGCEDGADHPTAIAGGSSLTRRETEVLGWLREAKTGPEIAIILRCSQRTVESHVARIYRKLGIHRRGQVMFQNQRQQSEI